MAQQPRYNVQSGVPGGVMPEGTAQVANAAISLSDKLGKMAADTAEEIGIPKAKERGAIAGRELSWKPGLSIGRIGMAYEESARAANDQAIEDQITSRAQAVADELSRTPDGFKQFRPRMQAATTQLLAAVSPSRRQTAAGIAEGVMKKGESAVLSANTKMNVQQLAEMHKANWDRAVVDLQNAVANGDAEAEANAKARIEESRWYIYGQAVRRDANGVEQRVSPSEIDAMRFNADGTPKDNVDYEANGVTFKTGMLMDSGDLYRMSQKSDEDVAYASVVGGFNRAYDAGLGSQYLESIDSRLSASGLPYDKQMAIKHSLMSMMRKNLATSAAVNREADKKMKAQGRRDMALFRDRMRASIKDPSVPEPTQEEFDRLKEYALYDPEGFDETSTLFYGDKFADVEDDDGVVAQIQNSIDLRDAGDATVRLSNAKRRGRISPEMEDLLQKRISKVEQDRGKSVFETDASVKSVLDEAKSRLFSTYGVDILSGEKPQELLYAQQRLESMLEEQLSYPNVRMSDRVRIAQDLSNAFVSNVVSNMLQPKMAGIGYSSYTSYASGAPGPGNYLPIDKYTARLFGGVDAHPVQGSDQVSFDKPRFPGADRFFKAFTGKDGRTHYGFDSIGFMQEAQRMARVGEITSTDRDEAIIAADKMLSFQRLSPVHQAFIKEMFNKYYVEPTIGPSPE